MEASSFKPTMNGTEGTESQEAGVKVETQKTVRYADLHLRFLAILSFLVAIVVLALSNETGTIPVIIDRMSPPVNIEATAKWRYLSQIVYFMVINIIACVYAAVSFVLLSIGNRGGSSKILELLIIVLDLVIMSLVFSSNGACSAVGVLAYHGNSHVGWSKVCYAFSSNCRYIAASNALSLLGALIFLSLIIIAVVNLRKRAY